MSTKDVMYEVYDCDGKYLFAGVTDTIEVGFESDNEIYMTGAPRTVSCRNSQFLRFTPSDELRSTFKRHEYSRIKLKFYNNKIDGQASGYVECESDEVLIKDARCEYTRKPSVKDELLAQLDELKRKIEEAFE